MARIHTVKAFRGQRNCQFVSEGEYTVCGKTRSEHDTLDHPFTQAPLRCGAGCGEDIEVGQSYRHVSLKTGPYSSLRKTRHTTCPPFRASDLTTSPHLSAMYEAIEQAEDSVNEVKPPGDMDEVTATLSELESIRDDFAATITEVGEGYRESAENMEEGFGHPTYQSEELAEKADAMDAWAQDIEAVVFDEPDYYEDGEEWDDDAAESWLEDQANLISEAASEAPY